MGADRRDAARCHGVRRAQGRERGDALPGLHSGSAVGADCETQRTDRGALMTSLRIVCTGRDRTEHTVAELARFDWRPAGDQPAVWPASAPLATLDLELIAESARPRRDGKSSRRVEHTPVPHVVRSDGGQTWQIPACPKCGRPATPLRDTTIRRYAEAVRNTPL